MQALTTSLGFSRFFDSLVGAMTLMDLYIHGDFDKVMNFQDLGYYNYLRNILQLVSSKVIKSQKYATFGI